MLLFFQLNSYLFQAAFSSRSIQQPLLPYGPGSHLPAPDASLSRWLQRKPWPLLSTLDLYSCSLLFPSVDNLIYNFKLPLFVVHLNLVVAFQRTGSKKIPRMVNDLLAVFLYHGFGLRNPVGQLRSSEIYRPIAHPTPPPITIEHVLLYLSYTEALSFSSAHYQPSFLTPGCSRPAAQ